MKTRKNFKPNRRRLLELNLWITKQQEMNLREYLSKGDPNRTAGAPTSSVDTSKRLKFAYFFVRGHFEWFRRCHRFEVWGE